MEYSAILKLFNKIVHFKAMQKFLDEFCEATLLARRVFSGGESATYVSRQQVQVEAARHGGGKGKAGPGEHVACRAELRLRN